MKFERGGEGGTDEDEGKKDEEEEVIEVVEKMKVMKKDGETEEEMELMNKMKKEEGEKIMVVTEVMEKERGRGERGEIERDRGEGGGNCRERGRVPLHAILLQISDYPQPSRMWGEREGQNTPGHPERALKENMVDISHHHSASSHTAAFSPKQRPPEDRSC